MNVRRILELDRTYMPRKTVSWKDAFRLVIKGSAVAEAYYEDWAVHSGMRGTEQYRAWQVPAVIRTLGKYRQPQFNVQPNRANVFHRDNYTCQYCGEWYGKNHYGWLELEHILPSSRGGQNTWTNLVTACSTCNNKKADRTPEEAGMKLLSEPKKPSPHSFALNRILKGSPLQPEWLDYMKYFGLSDQKLRGLMDGSR